MKLKNLLLTAVFISLFGLVACQKEIANTDPNNPATVLGDSNYLSKVYFVDSTNNAEDTVGSYSFIYDNAKRVQLTLDSSIQNNGFGLVQTASVTKFYYSGADTLPFKSSSKSSGFNGFYDTAINFYQYNLQGKMVKDSGFYYPHYIDRAGNDSYDEYYSITTLQYAGNKIYIKYADTLLYTKDTTVPYYRSHSESYDTASIDASKNITYDTYFRTGGSLPGTIAFTYDSHPNPFYRLNIFNTMFQQPSIYNTDYYFLSKNNILSIQKSDVNSTQKSTYIYQYYSSGYPKQSVSQVQFGATPKYDKIIYVYRSL